MLVLLFLAPTKFGVCAGWFLDWKPSRKDGLRSASRLLTEPFSESAF